MNLPDVPLSEAPLAFLDVETTGLSPRDGDRVCEIAVVRCCGAEELGRFGSLVNPGRPISPGASAVNGISDDMVTRSPSFADIADDLSDIVQNAILVCHNAPFDVKFLSAEFGLSGRAPWSGIVLDTLALARRRYYFPSNRLEYIARSLGIGALGAHRALADVLITKQVFDRFAADMENDGFRLVKDWLRLQGQLNLEPGYASSSCHPLIEEAMENRGKVRITYFSTTGGHTERIIEPILVDGGYLVAYCHLRGGERTFRLDRIFAVHTVD